MSKKVENIIGKIKKHPGNINALYRYVCNLSWEQSEEFCCFLLDNIALLDNIESDLTYAGTDKKSEKGWKPLEYRSNSRKGAPIDFKQKEGEPILREENHLAMKIFSQGRPKGTDIRNPYPIDGVGYVLDYEMPIGGTNTLLKVKENDMYDCNHTYGIEYYDYKDKKIKLFSPGKCDLVAFDDKLKRYLILELKKEDNEEPLIRAVMESFTYRKMLDVKSAAKNLRDYYHKLNIPDNLPWVASPLLYYKKSQYEEYLKKNSKLRSLMEVLDIKPIWYEYSENNGFRVIRD